MSDQPILLGTPNDPKLIGKVDLFTGAGLDTAIAKLDAFVGGAFTDSSDEDPFPFGLGAEEVPEEERQGTAAAETAAAPQEEAILSETDSSDPDPVDQEDLDAADGLDRILDRLDSEEVAPETGPDERPLSLLDLDARSEDGLEITSAPISPIADILARTTDGVSELDAGFYDDPGLEEEIYGAAGSDEDGPDLPETVTTAKADAYDPLEDMRDFDPDLFDPDEDPDDLPETAAAAETDPFDAFDQDALDADPEEETAGAGAGYDHALPEPTPFGDPTGMGGLFPEEDFSAAGDPAQELKSDLDLPLLEETDAVSDEVQDWDPPVAPRRVATPRSEESVLDALMADLNWGGARPEEAAAPPREEVPETEDRILTDLPDEEAAPQAATTATDPEDAPEKAARNWSGIPAFLRPGAGPRLGDLSDARKPDSPADPATLSWNEVISDPVVVADGRVSDTSWNDDWDRPETEETDMTRDAEPIAEVRDVELPDAEEAPLPDTAPEETSEEAPARRGRKRLLLGVAAAALLAVGIGGFLTLSAPGPTGSSVIARAPLDQGSRLPPVADFVPATTETGIPFGPASDQAPETGPETAQTGADGSSEDPNLVTANPVEPVNDLAEGVSPDPAQAPDTTVLAGDLPITNPSAPVIVETRAPEEVVAPETAVLTDPAVAGVPSEIAELMREIGRPETASGASSEQVRVLETRLSELETRLATTLERAEAASSELTGLTDQITGVMQRNSEQAERIDRMERMIRGQSAILAQVGQMEESLEQTQIVLLDVSARIGKVEGQNPADRDAVNRALADLESRIQALTANMSILARMSIEGVDALRAPNASSATSEVRTAPARADEAGGSNTVFRTQQGGFRISSDAAGRVPANVKKDDFIEGYGYVLDVLPASDGQRLVVMENGSVLIPTAD